MSTALEEAGRPQRRQSAPPCPMPFLFVYGGWYRLSSVHPLARRKSVRCHVHTILPLCLFFQVAYLHEGLEPKGVHSDIKSSTILLDKWWNPKRVVTPSVLCRQCARVEKPVPRHLQDLQARKY